MDQFVEHSSALSGHSMMLGLLGGAPAGRVQHRKSRRWRFSWGKVVFRLGITLDGSKINILVFFGKSGFSF